MKTRRWRRYTITLHDLTISDVLELEELVAKHAGPYGTLPRDEQISVKIARQVKTRARRIRRDYNL